MQACKDCGAAISPHDHVYSGLCGECLMRHKQGKGVFSKCEPPTTYPLINKQEHLDITYLKGQVARALIDLNRLNRNISYAEDYKNYDLIRGAIRILERLVQ